MNLTQKISQMTPKGADLDATDLIEVSTLEAGSYVTKSITGQEIIDAASGGGAAWGSITGTLSTQTDLQNALDAKQDDLVSGTNIKTIEGQSLLGSGNIDLTKSDVGLSNVDNTSDLNKPISTDTQTALNAKQDTLTLTTTGTSGAATLVGSTLNIPQYGGGGASGIHVQIKPRTGAAYSNNLISGSGTFGNSGSILYLTPFIPVNTLTITSAAIQVTTAGAATNMKILVYSDVNGLPTTLLLESSLLDISTTGFKTFTTSFTFNAGTTYWIGTIASGSAGVITSTTQSIQIGVNPSSNQSFNGFSLSGVNITSIPSTLSLTSGNLANLSSQPRVTFISA